MWYKYILIHIVFLSPILSASYFTGHLPHKSICLNYMSDIDWVKLATKKYSPNSWNLLEQYENLPAKQEIRIKEGITISVQKPVKTFNYLNGNSKTDLLLSMSTNVHEISHAFYRTNSLKYARENNIQLNWDNAEGYIYLSPSNSFFISVPRKILFPSRKLTTVIPHRMKSFRYETYIKGNTSTQEEGVIGLLNEYHAYYHGSKFTFDMLEAYIISEGKAKGFHYWVLHGQSTMSAFYEFEYFIREYLLYMKQNNRADYETLLKDSHFKVAYTSTQNLYSNLIKAYETAINEQITLLNKSKEAEVTMEGDMLWIAPAGSKFRHGTSVFSEDKSKIEFILKSERYRPIEKDLSE